MPDEVITSSGRQLLGKVDKFLLADDRGIKQNMPVWGKTTGHEFLGMGESKEIKVYVKTRVKAHISIVSPKLGRMTSIPLLPRWSM